MFSQLLKHSGFLLIFLGLASCAMQRSQEMTTPIQVENFHTNESNKRLVILLPGIGDAPQSFVENGAVGALLECNNESNVIGVNAHFEYYKAKQVVQRLKEDIIEPAKKQGINEIWMMGISLGGFGSLLYREDYPEDLQGIVILAPYLGKEKSLKAYLNDDKSSEHFPDAERLAFWQYIEKTATEKPAVTLAYGSRDKFASLNDWLAGKLAREKVIKQKGSHNWRTWKQLWPEALRKSGFCL